MFHRWIVFVLLALVGLLGLAGCSNAPTAPAAPPTAPGCVAIELSVELVAQTSNVFILTIEPDGAYELWVDGELRPGFVQSGHVLVIDTGAGKHTIYVRRGGCVSPPVSAVVG